MFPHVYFQPNYFKPTYWPPVGEEIGPGGGGFEEEGGEAGIPLYEAARIVHRIREEIRIRKERVTTDEEDAILLLLLSDLFGSIGGYPLQSKVIKDTDEDALLLLLANQWPI